MSFLSVILHCLYWLQHNNAERNDRVKVFLSGVTDLLIGIENSAYQDWLHARVLKTHGPCNSARSRAKGCLGIGRLYSEELTAGQDSVKLA